MRKSLFKPKTGKFGSIISLMGITAMLSLFSLALPGFLTSTTGRIFAVIWAVTAILMFIVHAKHLSPDRKRSGMQYLTDHKKDARVLKQERRYLRG